MNRWTKLVRLLAAAAVAATPLLARVPSSFADGATVNGGGSSFAKLEIDQWQAETGKAPYSLSVNYNSQGSTYGRTQYIQGSLDFGASDIPFQPSEIGPLNASPRKDFVYVPVSAGGLGLMYNLTDESGAQITDLKLTRRAACRIFTETADLYWDDPDIAGPNPDIAFKHELVRPVVRQDGSGTSYVFSQFCIAVAPDVWQKFAATLGPQTGDPELIAGRPTSTWPPQFGHSVTGFNADGVASVVADSNGEGTITYNEAGFAIKDGFPNALMQTAAGNFLAPTAANVNKALSYAQKNDDGTFILKFSASDPAAYFPSTYSYVISQTTGFDPAKGQVLARFLCYAVTKGQGKQSIPDGYAPLSAELVAIAKDAIAKIPGAPPWEQCAVLSGSPTVTTTTPSTTTAPKSVTTKAGQPAATQPGGATVTQAGSSSVTTKAGSSTATTKAGSSTVTTKSGSSTVTTKATSTVTVVGGAPATISPTCTTSVATTPDPLTPTATDLSTTASTESSVPATTASSSDASCVVDGQQTAVDSGAAGGTSETDAAALTVDTPPDSVDGRTQAAISSGQVAVKKAGPVVSAEAKVGVDGQQVAWALLEGAGVCALGVLVAGASKREGLRS